MRTIKLYFSLLACGSCYASADYDFYNFDIIFHLQDKVCASIIENYGQPGIFSSEYCFNASVGIVTATWGWLELTSDGCLKHEDRAENPVDKLTMNQLVNIASELRVKSLSFAPDRGSGDFLRLIKVERDSSRRLLFNIDEDNTRGWPTMMVQEDVATRLYRAMERLLPPTLPLPKEIRAFESHWK